MGDILSLSRARKARARAAASAQAAANRARFGRTGAEKQADADEAARLARMLDGAERDNS